MKQPITKENNQQDIKTGVAYVVLDLGRVVFDSQDEIDAKTYLQNRKRGVLCKVLQICCTEFIRENRRR